MREALANANTTIFRAAILRRAVANLHYGVTVVLAIALFPALKAAGLPTKIHWSNFLLLYWVGLAIQSMFWACVLYLVGFPARETLLPIGSRYKREKGRFLILIPLFVYLLWLHGFHGFIVLCVIGLATFELVDRTRNSPGGFWKSISSFLIPASYLFAGLIVVFIFSQIVVALKFHEAYDKVLDRIDAWFLLGRTVTEIAHQAMLGSPTWVFRSFDIAYFTMVPLTGAGILLIGVARGRKRAFQYVGTIMTAYYLALLIFCFWPSQSPFYSCPTHFAVLPHGLISYGVQYDLLYYLKLLGNHGHIDSIEVGYYMAFPCMHIGLPVILLWFVRQWRRLFVILLIYDLFLMVAIVMLEFHYVIDLVGGVAVALLAILMVDGTSRIRQPAG